MRMPIQYALTYPERVASKGCALDWSALRKLDFEQVPAKKFPCLTLAREAARIGGPLPCALNAADEIAVAAFLENRLDFLGIARVVEHVLQRMPRTRMSSIEDVLAADAEARRLAREAAVGRRKAS
jgi:1-deoxy-D-xylulose-5-phosphate reductoisomerase